MQHTERIAVPPLALQLCWKGDRIHEILLSWTSRPGRPQTPSPQAARLQSDLARYLRGEKVAWPRLPLDWDRLSPFARQVLTVLRDQVGWGEWIAYSELARRCNNPNAARAVGAVLRANPWPLVVPCHRVIGKKGDLPGFGGGLALKKLLLDLEGAFPSCEG